MKYVLDGYNVIGRAKSLCLGDPHKVYALADWIIDHKRDNDIFSIILDGKSIENTFGQNECYKGIDLYYTAHGVSADQYIMETISALSNKKEYVVVSSDKEILRYIKSIRGSIITSDVFVQGLLSNEKCLNSKPQPSDDDVDYWLGQFQSDSVDY